MNGFSTGKRNHPHGGGTHAERILINRYGKNIARILIARIGRSGENRPIDPCPVCKKIADEMGIKIESITND